MFNIEDIVVSHTKRVVMGLYVRSVSPRSFVENQPVIARGVGSCPSTACACKNV